MIARIILRIVRIVYPIAFMRGICIFAQIAPKRFAAAIKRALIYLVSHAFSEESSVIITKKDKRFQSISYTSEKKLVIIPAKKSIEEIKNKAFQAIKRFL